MVVERNEYWFFPDDMSEKDKKKWIKERSSPEELKALRKRQEEARKTKNNETGNK